MRWLHVFEIALKQTERGKWFESTLELQLASFQLCVACRGVRTLLVTIGFSIPLSLWGGDDHSDDLLKPTKWRQVSPLRAASVAWIMSVDTLVPTLLESDLLSGVESMTMLVPNRKDWDTNPYEVDKGPTTTHLPQLSLDPLTVSPERGYRGLGARVFQVCG